MRLLPLLFLSLALTAPGAAQPLLERFGRAQGLPSEYVLALLATRSGYLWIGTDAGLARYDGAQVETFTPRDGLPHPYVMALAEADDGTVWIGTGDGLARHDGATLAREPLPLGGAVDFVLAHDGVVAATVQGGVVWRVGAQAWQHSEDARCGTQRPVDKQRLLRLEVPGTLVVQCEGGAWRYALDAARPPTYQTTAPMPWRAEADLGRYRLVARDGTSYTGNRVRLQATVRGTPHPIWQGHIEGLVEDYEGTVWFGTFGQGLFRVDAVDLRRLSRGPALRLARDDRGMVWATGDTLLRIDARTLRVARTPTALPTRVLAVRGGLHYVATNVFAYRLADLLSGSGHPVAYADSWISGLAFQGDTLLVASYGQGLVRRVGGRQTDSLSAGHGLPTSTLEDVVCGSGACWLLTRTEGAVRLVGTRATRYGEAEGLPSAAVFSVYQARDGSTWFGTDRGAGHLAGHVLRRVGEEALAGQRVLGFFERAADAGALWSVTDGRLARIDGATGATRRSARRIAPPGVSINAVLYDPPTDRLFVATPQGVAVVEMAGVAAFSLPPPRVAFARVEVDGVDVAARGAPLRLPTPHARLTVQAALLSFAGGVRGEYRLQGGPWQTLGEGRTVAFPRLAPGRYTLDVRAVNAEGTPSQRPARLSFAVPYPWWRHPATLGGSMGLALALVAFGSRALAARRFARQVASYAAERRFQAERERLSRDLHDYVGGQLATLVTATELVELSAGRDDAVQTAAHAQAAGLAARQTLFQVRQTVHTLRSETLTPSLLYAQLCAQAAGQLRFVDRPVLAAAADIAPDAPALPSMAALQVLRIAQEALTNIVRHAHAQAVRLDVAATDDAFTLAVEDDGVGLDGRAPGNGRTIMAARAREIGAALAWHTGTGGHGTRVVLRVPAGPPNR